MVGIPAWCPNCNEMVDGSGGLIIEGSQVTMSNNVTNCPQCGTTARLIEGQFEIRDGIIDVITASPWTRAKLAEYQSALEWAAKNFDSQPEAAIARIQESSPETATFLRRMVSEPWSRTDLLTLIGTLIALAALLQAVVGGGLTQVDVHQITQIFNEAPEKFGWLDGGGHPKPGP